MTRKPPPDPPEGLTAVDRNEWERIWRRVVADPAIKLVGWTAASWADPDGTRIFPGARKVAASTGLTETTVKNALAVIRQTGLMWRYVEGSKHGRAGLSDEYRLTVSDDILGRVPMLSPDYEPTGTGRLRTRDLRTRVLSNGNRSTEVTEQVGSGDPTTTAPLHPPLQRENPAVLLAVGTSTSVGRDPAVEDKDKILADFAAGGLARARSDVPSLRPCAVAVGDLCQRCGQADHATPECPTWG